jgi:hypothetical protein
MNGRWVPVVAAVVGLLGGMAGAYVGGSVANNGQQQRFESEREAARQDIRQETFAKYLQVANGLLVKLQIKAQGAAPVTDQELKQGVLDAVAAEAAVDLLADSELQDVANELVTALAREDVETATTLREEFISLAKEEINQ